MTRTEINQQLRQQRRPLVLAAEQVIRAAFAAATRLPKKTQFSRLINLCGEASCAEELENYLRYQAGRKQGWEVAFVDDVIAGVTGVVPEDQPDAYRVEAWRLYATYLMRAFTYEAARRPAS